MLFIPGWHMPNSGKSGTRNFPYVCISYNKLEKRKSPFPVQKWLLDCGFTRILNGKPYPSTKKYAEAIYKWASNGELMGASTQDYACFDEALATTGLDIETHQHLTVHRYHQIKKHLKNIHVDSVVQMHVDFQQYSEDCGCDDVVHVVSPQENNARAREEEDSEELPYNIDEIYDYVYEEFKESDLPYIIPILQGRTPEDYVRHLEQYGDIPRCAWVGVGSLKRRPNAEVKTILTSIKMVRPDLLLHGFGMSKRQLSNTGIAGMLHTADSQNAGLLNGARGQKYKHANDPAVALAYAEEVNEYSVQFNIFSLYYSQ